MQKNRLADEFHTLSQHYSALARQHLATIGAAPADEPVTMPADFAQAIRSFSWLATLSASPARAQCAGLASRIHLALDRYAVSRKASDRESVVQLLAALERGMAASTRP